MARQPMTTEKKPMQVDWWKSHSIRATEYAADVCGENPSTSPTPSITRAVQMPSIHQSKGSLFM